MKNSFSAILNLIMATATEKPFFKVFLGIKKAGASRAYVEHVPAFSGLSRRIVRNIPLK